MIYLDNAATTKISDEVLDSMMPYLTQDFGNAGSLHRLGRDAAEAIAKAREQVAAVFSCEPRQVIFTSGGTESNNLVFAGSAVRREHMGKPRLGCSNIEHDSVYRNVIKPGIDNPYIMSPSENGSVEVPPKPLPNDVGLLSVMFVNNETGLTNNIRHLSEWAHQSGALFHSDCVQATGLHDLNAKSLGDCDFMSISGHKIHAPKGIGALYVKEPDLFVPMIRGGHHQEFGLRGGTENVASIVGFGKACEIMLRDRVGLSNLLTMNKNRLVSAITIGLRNRGLRKIMRVNGGTSRYPSKTVSIYFEGVDAETLVLALDGKDIYISASSACRSHEAVPSRALMSMGLTKEEARSSVRFSVSEDLTEGEIIKAAKTIVDTVEILHNVYNQSKR